MCVTTYSDLSLLVLVVTIASRSLLPPAYPTGGSINLHARYTNPKSSNVTGSGLRVGADLRKTSEVAVKSDSE